MFKNIIAKTTSDRPHNEDVYGYRDNLIFVIDGATGLGENDFMGWGDDAKWFVYSIGEYLKNNLHKQPIKTCLLKGCIPLYEEYAKRASSLNAHSMPSGCIALFREIGDEIEYYGLGDSVGICELKDGTIDVLFDQNLVNLDTIAINEMIAIAKEKNISPIEARKYIQDILIHNRNLMNTPEGYYSLELTAKGLPFAINKKWKKADVKRVCVMSDGLYEAMEFHLYDSIKLFLDAIQTDVDNVFTLLYQMQEEDKLGYKVPRFKLRDDTTVVFAEIEEA